PRRRLRLSPTRRSSDLLGAAVEKAGAQPRYASLRAGDIVGEHLVQFTTGGERIELVHRAVNRDIFARGAVHAALALAGRPPGVQDRKSTRLNSSHVKIS